MTQDEIQRLDDLATAAHPGEWRVRDGRVTTYQGEALTDEPSLTLMAEARSTIPRLTSAWRRTMASLDAARAEVQSWQSETRLLKERHRVDLARARDGQRDELSLMVIIEGIRLGILQLGAEHYAQRWADGADISHELTGLVRMARRRKADAKRLSIEHMERQALGLAELARVLGTVTRPSKAQRRAIRTIERLAQDMSERVRPRMLCEGLGCAPE